MNTKYHIIEHNDDAFSRVIQSNSNLGLDYILFAVEDYLERELFEGQVLFDLLLTNGVNDRFYIASFGKGRFFYHTIEAYKLNNKKTLKKIDNYYLENLELIESSNLSKPQKFLFKKEFYSAIES